jgi:hypothetical protein
VQRRLFPASSALLLPLLALVTGCSGMRERALERSVERGRARALREIDVSRCEREGGHVRGVGMFGTPSCVMPFADAGKACTDKEDCRGECVASGGAQVGERASGTCQADTASLFGCHNLVAQGVVVAGMCFD